MRYFIVDVFTDRKYAGNSLAVVETPKALSKARMQAIAAEFNLSETTFVIGGVDAKDLKGVKGSIDVRSGKTLAKVPAQLHATVRIFTPQAEVPFAGHPTLGTAHVIARHLHPSPSRAKPKPGSDATVQLPDVTLHLKAGAVPVRFDARSGLWWLTSPQPVFGPEHRDGQTTQAEQAAGIARILGLQREDIDLDFPVQEVSTGIAFLVVPLKSLQAVQKTNVDITAFKQYFATRGNSLGMPLFVFCRQTVHRQNQVHARMFAPTFGIAEDPATGSANACLAAYVLKHGYFGPDKTVLNPATNKTSNPMSYKVEQGFEMGRPSLLHVRAEILPMPKAITKAMSIQVGGQVVDVAEGRLL